MMTIKKFARVAPVVGVLVLVAAACELNEPPAFVDVGHVDGFAVSVEGGALDVHILDDEADVVRDPANTVLHARPGAQVQVPNNPQYAFLGPVGSTVWILPQVQNPNLLWLGWNTQAIGAGVLQGNQLTWRLNSVQGPGSFQIFTTGAFGAPSVIFNSANGLPDTTVVPVGTHAHGNWSFGAAGQYTLNFEATAVLANGTPVTSGVVPYTITVESYSCADIDDVTIDPSTVAGGGTVDVDYVVSNCGTVAATFPVQANVTAPAACGGATQVFALGSSPLASGASAAGSGSFPASACAGSYTVKVRAANATNSYVQQVTLTVT